MESVNFTRMRDSNRRAVLRLVHEHGTLSRAQLRERTRLTASAIHYIVDELCQAGFLERAGRAASTGGRPSELWRVNPRAAFTVGVHVGYTDTAAVVCDLDGQIIARSRGWTRPQASAQAILDDTAELIAAVAQAAAVPRARVVGVGVGIPGVVETPAGVSLFSPNLGWHDVPVQEELRARTGFTVWAEHDLRVATLGEWQHGA
ncbi:MAG TPA: ROK family protein, partial [Limnochordia bacterium]|nr:ROK family protein [Limnochordia bacterium]